MVCLSLSQDFDCSITLRKRVILTTFTLTNKFLTGIVTTTGLLLFEIAKDLKLLMGGKWC